MLAFSLFLKSRDNLQITHCLPQVEFMDTSHTSIKLVLCFRLIGHLCSIVTSPIILLSISLTDWRCASTSRSAPIRDIYQIVLATQDVDLSLNNLLISIARAVEVRVLANALEDSRELSLSKLLDTAESKTLYVKVGPEVLGNAHECSSNSGPHVCEHICGFCFLRTLLGKRREDRSLYGRIVLLHQ